MYVILINNDNTMSAPKKQRIMQRSKLVDDLIILVPQVYNNIDMTDCRVLLEYLLPVSRKYETELLELCEEKYEDHLKYKLPVDTKLTNEAGEIELMLTFAKVDFDADGNMSQRVRKVDGLSIQVFPIKKWADVIPDNALSAIDQRLIKVDAQIRAVSDMNDMLYTTKADDIAYEDNKLQLLANGQRIGSVVDITSCDDNLEDGVPVVDFSGSTDFVTPDDTVQDKNDYDNVVEFDPNNTAKYLDNVVKF